MSKSKEAIPELVVHIQYQDLAINVKGTYENVWKAVNDFFKKIVVTFPSESSIVSIKGKDIPKILLQIRNHNYFNIPRTTKETYIKLQELGKTDCTYNVVSMALKRFTMDGELKRFRKNQKYVYCAPYTNITKSDDEERT